MGGLAHSGEALDRRGERGPVERRDGRDELGVGARSAGGPALAVHRRPVDPQPDVRALGELGHDRRQCLLRGLHLGQTRRVRLLHRARGVEHEQKPALLPVAWRVRRRVGRTGARSHRDRGGHGAGRQGQDGGGGGGDGREHGADPTGGGVTHAASSPRLHVCKCEPTIRDRKWQAVPHPRVSQTPARLWSRHGLPCHPHRPGPRRRRDGGAGPALPRGGTSWPRPISGMPGERSPSCWRRPAPEPGRFTPGAIGTGVNGDLIRSALGADGVEMSAPTVADRDTGVCVVLVEPTGERTFVTTQGRRARDHRPVAAVLRADRGRPRVPQRLLVGGAHA